MSRDLYWEQHWDDLSEKEKWEQSIDFWERKKWELLRKFLTPEQLEATKNVDGIVRKMRYALQRELEDNPVAKDWPVVADWEDYNAD
tara:strand:- start:337 stop:597 length:261 start_codon:yes stop_codon:yes gene_type:complete